MSHYVLSIHKFCNCYSYPKLGLNGICRFHCEELLVCTHTLWFLNELVNHFIFGFDLIIQINTCVCARLWTYWGIISYKFGNPSALRDGVLITNITFHCHYSWWHIFWKYRESWEAFLPLEHLNSDLKCLRTHISVSS
mgnify:FL=1